jgi:hypothetical protein
MDIGLREISFVPIWGIVAGVRSTQGNRKSGTPVWEGYLISLKQRAAIPHIQTVNPINGNGLLFGRFNITFVMADEISSYFIEGVRIY